MTRKEALLLFDIQQCMRMLKTVRSNISHYHGPETLGPRGGDSGYRNFMGDLGAALISLDELDMLIRKRIAKEEKKK